MDQFFLIHAEKNTHRLIKKLEIARPVHPCASCSLAFWAYCWAKWEAVLCSDAHHKTHRLIKKLVLRVLFIALWAYCWANCWAKTGPLFSVLMPITQNGTQRLFSSLTNRTSFLFFSLSTFNNAFNAGCCSIQLVFNAFHLPTKHKTIKTEKERNSETHKTLPPVLPSLEWISSPLWTPLPPLWTPLPPLWVSTFTGKSH